MGLRKDIIFSLILLMLLQLVTCSSYADRFNRSRRLGGGFGFANLSPAQHNASFGGEAQKGADGAVDDEKRMVYTGPNPLHNK